jgi:hypothetical protein
MTCSTVCVAPPQEQFVGRSGRNLAVYDPMKAWPVMSLTRVESTALSWPFDRWITGGILPFGGAGRVM